MFNILIITKPHSFGNMLNYMGFGRYAFAWSVLYFMNLCRVHNITQALIAPNSPSDSSREIAGIMLRNRCWPIIFHTVRCCFRR